MDRARPAPEKVPWVTTVFGLAFVTAFFVFLSAKGWLPPSYFKLYDENIIFFSGAQRLSENEK